MEIGLAVAGLIAFLLLIAIVSGIRVVQEYERGVIFRLGRVLRRPRGPGLFFIIPYGIDRMVKVNLQTVTLDVPPQDVITKDNVTVNVDAVVYYKVVDPVRATVEVQRYARATAQLAQTSLRSVIGQVTLDDLLSKRDEINDRLARVIDEPTDPWGIKIQLVEIKGVDLPENMERAMAAEAQAERDRRAQLIAAGGELEASQKLAEAAAALSESPQALQLRFLQTIGSIAGENSTLVVPFPFEILPFFANLSNNAVPAQVQPPAPATAQLEPSPAEEEATPPKDGATAEDGAPDGTTAAPPRRRRTTPSRTTPARTAPRE
jgi:regulator of protease activity HflC (stomatin/prohibitin superfamily)